MDPFISTICMLGVGVVSHFIKDTSSDVSNVGLGAVGSMIATRADTIVKSVSERLQRGGEPLNHDLQKAVRRAYLEATLSVSEICKDIIISSQDEIELLDILYKKLNKEIDKLSGAKYIPPNAAALEEIKLLLQSGNATPAERLKEFRDKLKKGIISEIMHWHESERWKHPVPDKLTEMIENRWFDFMSLYFAEILKTDPKVQAIFQSGLLTGVSFRLESLTEAFENFGKAAVEWMSRIEKDLKDLSKTSHRTDETTQETQKDVKELGKISRRIDETTQETSKDIRMFQQGFEKFREDFFVGHEALLKAVSDHHLKNAYHQSLPADFSAYPHITPESVIAHLCDIPKQPNHTLPLLIFFQLIATAEPKIAQELKELSKQLASAYDIDLEIKKTEPEPPCKVALPSKFAPYLLVILKPAPNNENIDKGKLYSVQILFWRTASEIIPWYNDSEPPIPLDNIPELLDDIFVKDYKNNRVLRRESEVPETIEFFLPFELISCDVDQWLIKKGFFKNKVGKEYHVVVRSFDRLKESEEYPSKNPLVHKKWTTRWEQFQQSNDTDNSVFWICEPDEYEAEPLCNDLECKKHITCMMMAFQPSDENKFLYAILDTGIPVALWFRKYPDCNLNSHEIKDKIESVVFGKNLSELPGLIKETRKKAEENTIGNHLTLFWEDRYRIPPDYWDKFDISLQAPEIRK